MMLDIRRDSHSHNPKDNFLKTLVIAGRHQQFAHVGFKRISVKRQKAPGPVSWTVLLFT